MGKERREGGGGEGRDGEANLAACCHYDSEHALPVAAAASSRSSGLGGQAVVFLVCLNKGAFALDQLRPNPALHTLMSGSIATDRGDRGE